MKQLFLCIALAMTGVSYAQWKQGEYVDEFGDKTGTKYNYIQATGVFSNSASTNAECIYFMEEGQGMVGITIYPYGGDTKESWMESAYNEVRIKSPNGEVVALLGFFYDQGMILLSDSEYKIFMDTIAPGGTYTVSTKYKGKYSESSYRFKFKI